METTTIATEQKTENFNFSNHFLKALMSALYYLIIYIPFILPFAIWGKAAARLSMLWESKSLGYNEENSAYPIYNFYFNYIVNFIFDASMFLVWPIGLIITIIELTNNVDAMGALTMLFGYYSSVIAMRAGKEIVFFVLNTLVSWFISVIVNIGQLIKNMWLLNIVIKRKDA